MDKFFSTEDDFNTIIRQNIDGNVVEIKKVSNGWTNIVYEVITDDKDYFFRFPRDEFWSRTIVNDCEFSEFIKDKTDYTTVNLVLRYDNGRPFSIHEKIEGVELSDIMNELTFDEINEISYDIANFMYQLHNISYNDIQIFKTNDISHELKGFIDELLIKHVDENDMRFWDIKKNDTVDCLVHGDLNSSNFLIGEDRKVKAFIDFGFAGYGNKYQDIARIIGRSLEKFKKPIVDEYEKISGIKVNNKILESEIDTWNNIDNAYINYMRQIGIYS